jgi:excisionase family DNA binding protein
VSNLRATLEAIPVAYDALGAFLLPGSLPPDPDRRTGPPIASRRAVLNLDVVDLLDTREKADADATRVDYALDRMAGARRQGVLPTLVSWTRLVDGELWDEGVEHEPPADGPTVASECAFLLAHVAWVDEQQWANEIEDDTAAMLRDMRKAVGELEVKKARLTCLQPGCGWDVEEEAGREVFRCTGCGRKWGRIELHNMAERKKPKTVKQIATLLGVSVRTIRYAIADGKLRPIARDGSADLFDLQQASAATMQAKYRKSA